MDAEVLVVLNKIASHLSTISLMLMCLCFIQCGACSS